MAMLADAAMTADAVRRLDTTKREGVFDQFRGIRSPRASVRYARPVESDSTRNRITHRALIPEQVYFLARIIHICPFSGTSAETWGLPASLATYMFRRSEHPGYENRQAFSRRAPRVDRASSLNRDHVVAA